MKKTVICLVQNQNHAEAIVRKLHTAGYATDAISVLFPNMETAKQFAHDLHTKAPDGALLGAEAGGAIGVTLGFFLGLGALAIPGVGPFIAAGPILAALGGGAAGALGGGITGALIGLGIPEGDAARLEGRIKSGQLMISVHVDTLDEQRRVEAIFRAEEADEVYATPDLGMNQGEPSTAP